MEVQDGEAEGRVTRKSRQEEGMNLEGASTQEWQIEEPEGESGGSSETSNTITNPEP